MTKQPGADTPDLKLSGRSEGGKFSEGNKFGRGNPHAKQVGQLRSALLNAVTEQDMKDAIAALTKKAKAGDTPAIKELLDRCLGRPVEADLLERLADLEALVEKVYIERQGGYGT